MYIFNTRSMRTATPPVAAETAAAFKQGDRVHHVDEDLDGVICYGPDSDGDYKVRFEKVEIFPRDALTTDGSGGGGDDGEDGDGDKDDEDDDTPKKRFDNYGWSEKGYNNGSLNIQPWRPPRCVFPCSGRHSKRGRVLRRASGLEAVRAAHRKIRPIHHWATWRLPGHEHRGLLHNSRDVSQSGSPRRVLFVCFANAAFNNF